MASRTVSPASPAAANDETASRLINAGVRLLASGGVKAVTARAAAGVASSSASAVNYYFGAREGLLLACFEDTLRQERQWRGRALRALAGLALEPVHFPDWFAALLSQRGVQRSEAALVERELFLQAERIPALLPLVVTWQAEIRQFLGEAMQCFRLPPEYGELAAELYHSAPDLRPADADDAIASTWIAVTARRFGRRLAGLTDDSGDWRALLENAARHDALDYARTRPVPAATARILDGAIRLIAREGAAGLTHRALAAECGVALSATTHYFASRGAIIRAAFEHLYRRVTANAPGPGKSAPPISVQDLARDIARASVAEDGAVSDEMTALNELIVAARRDPALSPLALHLLASRGGTSIHILQTVRPRLARLTRADAFLFSMGAVGALSLVRAAPGDGRRAILERGVVRRIAVLFG